ncbi:hypothetical protein [Methylovulum psychrotolerans]|uniref:Ppx/GppA phosphatase domain-containing protein n=1 Tax=Methylovulum psychrotolerans TaxID=1704499 RepID=A0A2S5CG39_9GAMM|nr:hypothetical protein [Methylovulum psychrotolerans]POZ49766.1 hypothetical protein AADEFJLK_04442 [Methylovulum psychrotolerans]
MAKQGKCSNFGNCSKADQGQIINHVAGQSFECPECGFHLIEINQGNGKKWLIIGVLVVLLGAGALAAFLITPASDPAPAPVQAALPPPSPIGNCTLLPVRKTAAPNWYAAIEIGGRGIKPLALKFNSQLEPEDAYPLDTQNVNATDQNNLPEVVDAVCQDINTFHEQYGDLPIYLIASSAFNGDEKKPQREEMQNVLVEKFHLPFEAVDVKCETHYTLESILAPPISLKHTVQSNQLTELLPQKRRCQAALLDIGSGNIKGGYYTHCDKDKLPEKAVSCSSQTAYALNEPNQYHYYEIPHLGTTEFAKQAKETATDKAIPFTEAIGQVRRNLDDKLSRQIDIHPYLTNNKDDKRLYLVGGAVWAMNTLLCLDCPQYDDRSKTDNQNRYTTLKLSDIAEFHRAVNTPNNALCDIENNPYLALDLDTKKTSPLSGERKRAQQEAITKVCNIFKPDTDLVAAAEILQATVNGMHIDGQRPLFFMQDNLYTWSRQYLIEKVTQGKP